MEADILYFLQFMFAIVIGLLVGIVFSVGYLVRMDRRVLRIEEGLSRIEREILSDETKELSILESRKANRKGKR